MNSPVSISSSGLIPSIPSLEACAVHTPDASLLEQNSIVGFDGQDIRARPFNLLRSQVQKRLDVNEWHLLGITSATPNAGKSFTSLNLAAAMSQMGERPVILCDFDLRRGSIASALGMNVEVGLGDFLEGATDDVGQIAQRVGDSRLIILPTRAVHGSSASLLTGERFRQLMEMLRAAAQQATVLFDLPPVFANDDAMISVQQLDAYLLVIDSGVTNKAHVQESMGLLSPAPCLGSVLNRFEGGIADAYGYGYRSKAYSAYYSKS